MTELDLDRIRFRVEHRTVGDDGGPTLHVFEAGGGGRELLRFDCFERTPHWHLAPHGENRITPLVAGDDNVSWTVAQLAGDLGGLLARAGLEPDGGIDPAALAQALREVELAMRNPPADLDGIDLERLRRTRGEKWALYPGDVISAWVADMDFPVANPIRRALRSALDLDDLGYPVHPRPGDLPALFAERAAERFGWSVDPARVELISEVVQGIFVALLGYTSEGDGVVIQTPIYPPFLLAVAETQRRTVEAPLVPGPERFEIDFDALRGALDDRSRVLLLCHPHNPTGRAFSRAELEGLAQVALDHDLVVVSDEIHADLVYPGQRHVPFATLAPEVEARTLTLTSASKAFNIAGLRCAVAVFGSEALKRDFQRLPRHARGGLNTLGMVATEAAWRYGQPWLDQVLDYLDGNRRFLAHFLTERLPGIAHRVPEATYLAWLDCRELELPGGPYRFFLDEARVALSDGRAFGEPGVGCVRLNFATSRAILTELLERMAKALRAPRPRR